MHNGQSHDPHHHQSPPPSASGSGSRQAIPDPESDYQSDDDHDHDHDTSSRIGAGGKRKRPVSVSYVHIHLSYLDLLNPPRQTNPALLHTNIVLLPSQNLLTSSLPDASCASSARYFRPVLPQARSYSTTSWTDLYGLGSL